ncbi:MAG: aldo/keto reductase [Candidatus Promineifilaceae bacterium]|jgi:aryl-alcohol dehydrogenase-like predicted oxidoreductase
MDEKRVQLRPLGKSGIRITPIGLGAWQFSKGQSFNRFFWKSLSEETQNAIVQAALDGGINWFDTAEAYGFGRSERGLSHALQAAGRSDGDVVIATKWMPFGRTAASIGKTIDKRQENLAPFHIDLHQIHNPNSFSQPEDEMDAMADLVLAGQIRAVGVSNFSAGQMLRAHSRIQAHGLPLASNQVKYNLLDRQIEGNGILEAARALGITIIAYSPLEWGVLTGKFHDNPGLVKRLPLVRRVSIGRMLEKSEPVIRLLKEIAAAHGVKPSQVALNWLVNFSGQTVVAIPGASKPHHAREAAGAMGFTLSDEELARLDEATRPFK